MDRIIEIKISGNFLSKDNKNAGVRGEGNVANLRITFDESWDNYAKKVTFWDAYGGNPVERTLTTDLLENVAESTRVYLVPIPPEPMTEAGVMSFVIDGYIEGKRQRSIEGKLEVKYAPMTDDAGEPTDPTPSPAEQWQVQIEKITDDIQRAYIARNEAQEYAQNAENSSESAQEWADKALSTVGKSSYIGDNGNWFVWDESIGDTGGFYDSGIRAQSGSIVYVGDNPPEDADVWINPNGKALMAVTHAELEAFVTESLLNWANKITPSPASITLYADSWVQGAGETMWYQEIVVANATVTPNSKVDLQPSPEQLYIFHEKDLAFVAENDEGKVTIFCIGQKPMNDYTIQVTVTEVIVNG